MPSGLRSSDRILPVILAAAFDPWWPYMPPPRVKAIEPPSLVK